jgi:hypothetical protein
MRKLIPKWKICRHDDQFWHELDWFSLLLIIRSTLGMIEESKIKIKNKYSKKHTINDITRNTNHIFCPEIR